MVAVRVIAQESITLTTIMLSQDTLRVKRGAVGTNYKDSTTYPDATIGDDNLIIEGNVGIGTITPEPSKGTGGYLDVKDVYLRDTSTWASAGGGGFSPASYNGEESITFPNGMIMKHGYVARTGTSTTITFASSFPNAVVSVSQNAKYPSYSNYMGHVTTFNTTKIVIEDSYQLASGFYWQAWGY